MRNTDDHLEAIMSELMARESAPSEQLCRKILILSTPRSGSTFFCDVLNKSASLGECGEWFNLRYMRAFQKLSGLESMSFAAYARWVTLQTLRGSDAFVVNVHIQNYLTLKDSHSFDLMDFGFDSIFFLTRKQKLKQAISLAKAIITDQWAARRIKADAQPQISLRNISQALELILSSEQYYWEHLQKFVTYEFCYETFQDFNAPEGFKKLFELLGLDSNVDFYTDMTQQSDGTSDQLAEAFLALLQGTNVEYQR